MYNTICMYKASPRGQTVKRGVFDGRGSRIVYVEYGNSKIASGPPMSFIHATYYYRQLNRL